MIQNHTSQTNIWTMQIRHYKLIHSQYHFCRMYSSPATRAFYYSKFYLVISYPEQSPSYPNLHRDTYIGLPLLPTTAVRPSPGVDNSPAYWGIHRVHPGVFLFHSQYTEHIRRGWTFQTFALAGWK